MTSPNSLAAMIPPAPAADGKAAAASNDAKRSVAELQSDQSNRHFPAALERTLKNSRAADRTADARKSGDSSDSQDDSSDAVEVADDCAKVDDAAEPVSDEPETNDPGNVDPLVAELAAAEVQTVPTLADLLPELPEITQEVQSIDDKAIGVLLGDAGDLPAIGDQAQTAADLMADLLLKDDSADQLPQLPQIDSTQELLASDEVQTAAPVAPTAIETTSNDDASDALEIAPTDGNDDKKIDLSQLGLDAMKTSQAAHSAAPVVHNNAPKSNLANEQDVPANTIEKVTAHERPEQAVAPVTTDSNNSATMQRESAMPQKPEIVALAQNANAASRMEGGNPMERAVASQVSRALVQVANNGARVVTIRLTPPELGTVRVQVFEQAGQLSARLHAEDDGVRVALERFLPQLRQDLRSNDAPLRDVSLADSYNSMMQQGNRGQQGQGRRRSNNPDGQTFSIEGVRERIETVSKKLGARIAANTVDATA